MEETYRGWVAALNGGVPVDFSKFLNPTFQHDHQTLTIEAWVESLLQIKEVLGPSHIDIDYIMADEDAQCLASRLLIKCKPQQPMMGITPSGQEVSYAEIQFAWFTNNGKMSRIDRVSDTAAIVKQLKDPNETYNFDSASKPETSTTTTLSKEELEKSYESLVESINTRTMREKFPQFAHEHMMRNIDSMEAMMAAMPDVRGTTRTTLVDAKAQRLFAQFELSGKPVAPIAGFEATGRTVAFNEHVLFEWVDGKVRRNWVLLDWDTMGKQLKGE